MEAPIVLLVEHDAAWQQRLTQLLSHPSYSVVTASSVEESRRLFNTGQLGRAVVVTRLGEEQVGSALGDLLDISHPETPMIVLTPPSQGPRGTAPFLPHFAPKPVLINIDPDLDQKLPAKVIQLMASLPGHRTTLPGDSTLAGPPTALPGTRTTKPATRRSPGKKAGRLPGRPTTRPGGRRKKRK
jgi:hypothetical protein